MGDTRLVVVQAGAPAEADAGENISPAVDIDDAHGSTRLDATLVAALTGNFFLRLGNAATGIMLTLFLGYISRTEFQISPWIVGTFSTAFYATELLLAPYCGAQSDRSGRRWFLLLGPLLGLIAVQLTAVAPLLAVTPVRELFTPLGHLMPALLWILLITRILEGLSSASSIPAILSYLSARTDHNRPLRGWVMALFESSTAIAIVGGSVAGTLMWGQLSYWAFAVLGVPYLVSTWLFQRVREQPQDLAPHRDLHHSAMAMARQPAIWKFLPAWLAVNAVVGLWNTHAVYQLQTNNPPIDQYLAGRFFGNTNGLALTLGIYALLFAGGTLIWGRAFGRFSETAIMRISLVGLFVACGAAWLINHSGDNHDLRVTSLVVFAVAIVVQSGFLPAAVGYLARLSSLIATDRGLFMGLYSVVLGAGALLGGALGAPFVGGNVPLVPGSIDGVIVLTGLLGVVSLVVVLALGSGEPYHAHHDDAAEATTRRAA